MAKNRSANAANGNGSAANLGFEEKLWSTADKLRNNMDAAEYRHVVLGLIFLKYIIDVIGTIGLGDAENRLKDILGRVYEYFLTKFASAEGKNGGQFYTPRCVVRVLIEMLPQITFDSVSHLPIVVPTIEVQTEFQNIVDPLDRKFAANEKQVARLATIRDTLLPKLLSGEIRVADAELLVEDMV